MRYWEVFLSVQSEVTSVLSISWWKNLCMFFRGCHPWGNRKSNGHFICLGLSSLDCKLMQSWCENWLHNEGQNLRNPNLPYTLCMSFSLVLGNLYYNRLSLEYTWIKAQIEWLQWLITVTLSSYTGFLSPKLYFKSMNQTSDIGNTKV